MSLGLFARVSPSQIALKYGCSLTAELRVLRKSNRPLSVIQEVATAFAPLDKPDEVRSSHALDVLADIFAETEGRKEDAVKVCFLFLVLLGGPRKKNWEILTAVGLQRRWISWHRGTI